VTGAEPTQDVGPGVVCEGPKSIKDGGYPARGNLASRFPKPPAAATEQPSTQPAGPAELTAKPVADAPTAERN